jgi:hypothetical protein
MRIVFDIETDGLLREATRIHVLSWKDVDDKSNRGSIHDYNEMVALLSEATELIGHHIVCYDLPVVETLLGWKPDAHVPITDTLPLSWYLEHNRAESHGLDAWGKTLGRKKPKIDDWKNLTREEYTHRCEEDVEINLMLHTRLMTRLGKLYKDEVDQRRMLDYLWFKMECIRDQEAQRIKLDVDEAGCLQAELSNLKDVAETALINVMPKRQLYKTMNPPKVMYKKDGELSSHGERWFAKLKELYLPATTNAPIQIEDGEEDANPSSSQQLKDWLFELGWKPRTFKYVKNKDADYRDKPRAIPQVKDDGELCRSVSALIEDNPEVAYLENLSVITHRLSVVDGFLSSQTDGYLEASVGGLTNTMRFKHRKPMVNLPGVDKPWGKEIRSLLTASYGNVLVGADMVSLEDNTKRHYMQPLDPDYVDAMSDPNFDPHLDLALHAGVITQKDIDDHVSGRRDISRLRKDYKTVNYAAVYGVGEETLSRQSSLSKKQAKALLKAYWERNWAVKKIAENAHVREVDGLKWIYNPVSKFWYSLRYDKDRWSTLNQSTGVYCFDTWIKHTRSLGIAPIFQAHDEGLWNIGKKDRQVVAQKLKAAIRRTNEELKLNVTLDVDVQFGDTYADCH